jgi:hypothetical protein
MVHSASSAFPNELPMLNGSRWLRSLCGNFQIFVGRGFTGCGKTPKLSFRGQGLPEESAFFLVLVKKQIPRCARDDKIADFFRSLESRIHSRYYTARLSAVP